MRAQRARDNEAESSCATWGNKEGRGEARRATGTMRSINYRSSRDDRSIARRVAPAEPFKLTSSGQHSN